MFRKLIPKGEFTKSVLTLMTGNSIAQVIQLAVIPILARLYTPADFGIFAVYLSISTIISTVAAFRYDLAIMLPKSEKEAVDLLVLTVFLTFVVSALSFIALLVLQPLINHFVQNKSIVKWLYYIPITIFFATMYQIFNVWANRKTRYKLMTASIISQRGSISATNILMGLARLGQAGLIFGNIIGQFVSVVILFVKSIGKDRKELSMTSLAGIRKVVSRYRKFPLFDSVNTIFFNFSTKGIIILLSKSFGDIVVGYYSMAERVMLTPFNFFTAAFSQAFYQKLSHTYNFNRDNFNQLILQAIHKIAQIITIPYIVLVITSKWYIPVILGHEWDILFKYIFIFAPFVYISLTSSPYTHALKIINKQNIALYMNLVTFIIKFLSIIIPVWVFHMDILTTIIIFSIVSFLSSLLAIIIINYYLKMAFSKFFALVSLIAVLTYAGFFLIY